MEVYVIARKQNITHGHGCVGEDLVMPIFDSYSEKYLGIPIFSKFNKAVEYINENDKYGFYTVVPVELI